MGLNVLSSNYWLKGLVGNVTPTTDGSEATARVGRMNDLLVSELQAKYYEATKRGAVFSLPGIATTTGIAALHLKGAAAAANAQFALVNPVGSGKDLVLLKFAAQVISGTVPAGPVWHAMFNANSVVAAKTGLIVGNYGSIGPGSVAADYATAASTALAGTGAPFVIRQSPINFSAGAYANLAGAGVAMEDIGGDLIIPQGYGWCPQWSGAGTSVLNYYNLTWAEVPA